MNVAEKFLQLSKKDAQNLAEQYNFIFYLLKVNGEDYLPYPQDERQDRVLVEIEKGLVTKALIS